MTMTNNDHAWRKKAVMSEKTINHPLLCNTDLHHVGNGRRFWPEEINKKPAEKSQSKRLDLYPSPIFTSIHLFFYISIAKLHYATPPTMANVLKRSALKLGMIPADGIGKEVLPVRSSSAPLITIFSLPHPS